MATQRIESSNDRGDPLGPNKRVASLASLEIQVDLLQDVLGLKRDHTGFVFQFLNGLKEFRLGDVAQYSFGIPFPVQKFLLQTKSA